jgi:hypothetical protein
MDEFPSGGRGGKGSFSPPTALSKEELLLLLDLTFFFYPHTGLCGPWPMSAQDHEQSELLNQPPESNNEFKADLGYPLHHPPEPSPHQHQPLLGRLWPAPKRLHPQSLLLDYIKHLVRVNDKSPLLFTNPVAVVFGSFSFFVFRFLPG